MSENQHDETDDEAVIRKGQDIKKTIPAHPSNGRLQAEFPVVIPITVRWGDMDAYQHVNNTLYFRYFEEARMAYFQQTLGTEDHTGLPEGVGPILHSTNCRFRAPVRHPDSLYVGVRVVDVQQDRFTMKFAVYSDHLDTMAAEGEALIVSYDYAENTKVDLPPEWLAAFQQMEGAQLGE